MRLKRFGEAAQLGLLFMLEDVVGDGHLDQDFEHFETQLSIGKLPQIARPVVVAEERHAADMIGEKPADRIDAGLAEAVDAAELLLDGRLFLHRIVPVGVGDLRKQASDCGHDASRRVVGVDEVALDDFREAVTRLGGHFVGRVFATKDHRGFNRPDDADAQGR